MAEGLTQRYPYANPKGRVVPAVSDIDVHKRDRHMKATRALRAMVKGSGLTATEISHRIGRTGNYLSSLLSRGSVPSVETFASIAQACGCKLCLITPDETIQLDGWEAKSGARTDASAGERGV